MLFILIQALLLRIIYGSAWVNHILNRPGVLFYTIVLTKVEVICAFN